MTKHKEIWGVRVIPFIKTSSTPVQDLNDARKLAEKQTKATLKFILKIGKFEPDDNKLGTQFVTNPTVQQRIWKTGLKEGNIIGVIRIEIKPFDELGTKLLTTWEYEPFSGNRALKETGVASFAELRIERVLEKAFPGYYIRSTEDPSLSRKKQLQKRGREPVRAYPINQAVELSSAYVRKGMKKYNQKMALMQRRKRKQQLKRINEKLARRRPSVVGGRKSKTRFLPRRK